MSLSDECDSGEFTLFSYTILEYNAAFALSFVGQQNMKMFSKLDVL